MDRRGEGSQSCPGVRLERSAHRRYLRSTDREVLCAHGLTGVVGEGRGAWEASAPVGTGKQGLLPHHVLHVPSLLGLPGELPRLVSGEQQRQEPPQAGLSWNFLENSHYPGRGQHVPGENRVLAPRLGSGPCSLVPTGKKSGGL